MTFNLEGKVFIPKTNSENGEVDSETQFFYHQNEGLVWAEYSGGKILKGHLIGKILGNGNIELRYHHLNTKNEFMTGKCISTPEILNDGRLMLKENWHWLSGGKGSGYSEIIEKTSV